MEQITFQDFLDIDICIGTIIKVDDFLEAKKPSYKLEVDFGEKIGIKKSSSQLKTMYSKKELIGKQVLGVINFPKKQIANFMSECLITGFIQNNGDVVLAIPDKKVDNGMRLL
ncbi:tRNA-binding protein [Candidatus Gracilibacteria bacterium]|nr:tRNA-binding protein [Candidatus Gracilibacteria bacterium]